jgi:lipopolysaccharide transport system ATP-binding protein
MSNTAIRVEHLAKQYNIGTIQQRYDTLRDQLVSGLKGVFTCHRGAAQEPESIWALKDVTFDVRQGEVLGIIGRNGAGKSTLLKILSRITEPTEGNARIYGRVASLLEVGTGFHAELTGRENIYLNGAVLGMSRTEINRKFDEIVAFSGVEKFIDTPVKRYSSGMTVRLAFSVAAHLDPEILIIDEVLAVGDQVFQNKCLGKMEEIAHTGRTVLFVSHNMGAVMNLCTSCMWIDQGQIARIGDVKETINAYIEEISKNDVRYKSDKNRDGTGEARIVDIRLLDFQKSARTVYSMGESLIIEFDVEFYKYFPVVDFALEIKRKNMGMNVVHIENRDCGLIIESIHPGKHIFQIDIPNVLLYPASYSISLCIWNYNSNIDYVTDALDFSVIQSNITQRKSPLSLHKQAIFYSPSKWKVII